MRIAVALCFALIASIALAAQPQQEKPPSKPPKKGDAITIKGCLEGPMLASTDLRTEDSTEELASALTFRLTGDKELLKKLREEHDGRVVELSGILKSTLPQRPRRTKQIGRTSIHIGIGAPQPGTAAEQATRSMPVIEVKSYDGTSIICKG